LKDAIAAAIEADTIVFRKKSSGTDGDALPVYHYLAQGGTATRYPRAQVVSGVGVGGGAVGRTEGVETKVPVEVLMGV
jgi:hypothetical protein